MNKFIFNQQSQWLSTNKISKANCINGGGENQCVPFGFSWQFIKKRVNIGKYKCSIVWLVTQSCLFLCNPLNCIRQAPVHGIFQARILEWLPFPSPRDLPHPGIKPASPVSCRQILYLLSDRGSPKHSTSMVNISIVYKLAILGGQHHIACGILVPRLGVKPLPPAVEI